MAAFRATRRIAVPPDAAFAIASDVAAYKEFLPLMKRSQVRGQRASEGSIDTFDAELVVAYDKLNLRESFVSRVVCNAAERTVTATSRDGPFKDMRTVWTIAEAPGGAEVGIAIDYVLKSTLMQIALAGLMDMAVARVMQAFEERARSRQLLA